MLLFFYFGFEEFLQLHEINVAAKIGLVKLCGRCFFRRRRQVYFQVFQFHRIYHRLLDPFVFGVKLLELAVATRC